MHRSRGDSHWPQFCKEWQLLHPLSRIPSTPDVTMPLIGTTGLGVNGLIRSVSKAIATKLSTQCENNNNNKKNKNKTGYCCSQLWIINVECPLDRPNLIHSLSVSKAKVTESMQLEKPTNQNTGYYCSQHWTIDAESPFERPNSGR